MTDDGVAVRLNAIEENVEWLREHGTDADGAPQRLGLIKGDVQALIRTAVEPDGDGEQA